RARSAARRARPGVAAHRRDLPALPALHGRGDPYGATPYKCAPPIRDAANREALWRALADGVLDMVASDHSPCSPGLKALEAGDFVAAWGGVAGLQLALPVVWTDASARGHTLVDVARWMSAAPARLARLAWKGAIAPGRDADLVVFDDAAL